MSTKRRPSERTGHTGWRRGAPSFRTVARKANPTPNFYHTGGGTNEVTVKTVFPATIRLKNLSVNAHTGLISGGQTFTVRVDSGAGSVDTTLSCTLSAGQSTCSDTDPSHTVTVNPLDRVSLKSVSSQTGSSAPPFHAVAEIGEIRLRLLQK